MNILLELFVVTFRVLWAFVLAAAKWLVRPKEKSGAGRRGRAKPWRMLPPRLSAFPLATAARAAEEAGRGGRRMRVGAVTHCACRAR